MNKNFISNFVTIVIITIGILIDNSVILSVGLFALSGALTNSIAIYMLFEKVPFLYGSGVIEQRFEQFKLTLENLIMEQFFNKENLNKFFKNEISNTDKKLDLTNLIETTDFTPAFNSLKLAVMESSFGGMLGMFGGESALAPLEKPFIEKIKVSIIEISNTSAFQIALYDTLKSNDMSDEIYKKLTDVVQLRLNELTPKMTKNIIQDMIREHLGWLVVWGAVFGGLIGLIGSLII
jgi:uncharacterized membrane protein YheB (UPF0754 family)